MGLETGSFISALVSTNPVGATDPKSQGDDHLRFIKAKLLETFPNVNAAVNGTPTELNLVVGATTGLATLSVSFAAAASSIAVLTTALSGFSLSTSVTSSDITGSIRTPVLQTQTGYTAGTFTAATVVVNNKGVITNVTAGTIANITLGTAQATTSGTEKDFTGIPAGTKRIKVMFSGVSTNGTSNLLIQLGAAGGFEATGYVSVGATNGTTVATSTAGFILSGTTAAAATSEGTITLDLEKAAAFTWTASGAIARSDGALNTMAGSKSLSAELTQVRITTVNGTDAFDAGEINISYE